MMWLLLVVLQTVPPSCPVGSVSWESELKAAGEDGAAALLRRWAYCDPDSLAAQASPDDKLDAIDWWVQWLHAQAQRATSTRHARALSRLSDDDDPLVRAHALAALCSVSRKY